MRRQLPVYSPLSFTGVAHAAFARATSSTELRERLARKYSVHPSSVTLTGTGTHALGLAIDLAARARRNRRVALPAYTCWDVGSAAQWSGVEIVYYDIDPTSLEPDLGSLTTAVQEDVAAVVVGPLFGYPIAWDEIRTVCDAYGSLLIEDAAQGQGCVWQDQPVGSFGDATMLSFGRGKGWTGGGGGALLLRSEELVTRGPASLTNTSMGSSATWSLKALAQAVLGRPSLYGLPAALPGSGLGQTEYHPPSSPSTMLPCAAALALATEPWAEREAEDRRKVGATLIARLEGTAGVEVISPSYPGAGFLRLGVRIPQVEPSWERRARPLGVERGYPLALPDVPELEASATDRFAGPLRVPGARILARELFSLPTHSLLTERDLNRIVTVLSDR